MGLDIKLVYIVIVSRNKVCLHCDRGSRTQLNQATVDIVTVCLGIQRVYIVAVGLDIKLVYIVIVDEVSESRHHACLCCDSGSRHHASTLCQWV